MTTATRTAAASDISGAKYYDLITTGTGLVSRIRDVTGKRKGATPSVYCTISVPLDPKGSANARWTAFDVKVCGVENIDLINSLRPEVAAQRRPVVHFSIGDIYGHAFEQTNQSNGKSVRAQLKGRLINVKLSQRDDVRQPLKTSGLGYVSRLHPTDPFAVLAAIHGDSDEVNYTYFDTRFADSEDGQQALSIVREFKCDEEVRVLVNFELNNVFATGFRFGEKSPKNGELGVNIFAEVNSIRWVRLNGQVVFEAPSKKLPDVDNSTAALVDDDSGIAEAILRHEQAFPVEAE